MTDEANTVVLYAEDSDDDAFLMRRGFKHAGFPGTLVVVPNGLEATRYLDGMDEYADRVAFPSPRAILLDIKMPRMNGLDVLKWVRCRHHFVDIPVIMLTSSSQETDVEAAAAGGADGYLVKPSQLATIRSLVEDIAVICAKEPSRLELRLRGSLLQPTRPA